MYRTITCWLSRTVLTLCCATLASAFAADTNVDAAKQLFANYVALEQNYDPAITSLYAEEALIRSRRTFPMGDPIDSVIALAEHRAQLRDFLAAAKARGERHSYSKVSYTPEGEFVRIEALRFSELKKRRSPITLLVGRAAGGQWLIFEELSELK